MSDLLDKTLSCPNIDQHMFQPVADYLSAKIPSYLGKDVLGLVIRAAVGGGLLLSAHGALGVVNENGNYRVLFFAADDKANRVELAKKFRDKFANATITYCRGKHNKKEYVHGPKFWERLCS